MMDAKFLFLGTGASLGVPVVGCECATCLCKNPFDKRSRSSGLILADGKSILIDCGPDFKAQALSAKLKNFDALVLTHPHYDHIGGLDDLRALFFTRQEPLPCFLSNYTAVDVKRRFDYMFKAENQPMITPKLDLQEFPFERGVAEICGIKIKILTYTQTGMPVNGLVVGNLAYISDIKEFPETIFQDLEGIEILIISALRSTPSFMHFNVDEAIAFSKKTTAKQTYLTHMAHELLYEKVNASLPANIQMAYDGLTLNFQI
ncbi:MAG TPA: MBL fold metallo-hydrolase [Parachlamydiaceae bacterium]|nr:MBL fold metallo-hydrolase [Parachlamydiaceae bacterium]